MANTKIPVELSSTPGIVDGSNATAITIDSSENVGIGTTSPSATDWGSASPVVQISGTQPLLSLKDSDVTDGEFQLANSGQNFYIYDAAASATRLFIKSDGNIGVGTTSPSVPLDIVTNLSSDTTTSPDTVLTIATKYASTSSNGGAGAGPRLEFQIPDYETNPITGEAIAGLK